MKKFLILVLILISQLSFCQQFILKPLPVKNPDTNGLKFNGGGLENFYDYLNKKFDCHKIKKSGDMVINFTLNYKGEIKNLKIDSYRNNDAAAEMTRVIEKSPKWKSQTRLEKTTNIELLLVLKFVSNGDFSDDAVFVISNEPVAVPDYDKNDSKIYKSSEAEIAPEFPGGFNAFAKYIAQNYKIPTEAKGIKGKVVLQFVIEIDGKLTEIKCSNDLGFGTCKEAIRVLLQSPNWRPGELNGRKIRVNYSTPISIDSTN
jgi:Gram-negative bacterial TonB protein C-terminal